MFFLSHYCRVLSHLGVTVPLTSLGCPPKLCPRMPSKTVLISGPAVGASQILIWSYSCLFLPPMSIAIRISEFSFVSTLNVLLYIPQTQSLPN